MTDRTVGLEKMMQQCSKPATVLAVTSGKGGVGKTNIAANLAICLAASRKRVTLFDADVSLGNLDIIMNLDNKYNISHLIDGQKNIEDIIHYGPEGLEIVCGASGLESLADMTQFNRQRLLKQLKKLQTRAETIVVDTGAGIGKSVVSFCLAADDVLVVTTPETTAMTDAYAMIKVLVGNKFAGRMSLVVNMANTKLEGKKVYKQISEVTRRFLNTHIYNAGILLKDEKVGFAVKQRKPVVLCYPKSEIAYSLIALAARLRNSSAARAENDSFFRKVVRSHPKTLRRRMTIQPS